MLKTHHLLVYGFRDTRHNSQQGRKIPTYVRKDKIINLWFTHDANKFLDSRALFYFIEAKYMLRMNPIVGSSTKKRLIHPNLMVREDARKAIRSIESLKSGPSFLIQVETSRGEFSAIERPQKKCSLSWKYVSEGFGLKRLILYLSKSARVFLIRGLHMQD